MGLIKNNAKRFSRWEKIQNAAHALNAQAYARVPQSAGQVHNCPRALVLLDHCQTDAVMIEVMNEVLDTPCACHPDLDFAGLLNLFYNPSYRMAHYRGDTAALYTE